MPDSAKQWHNAFLALISCRPSNPKPLADMLRRASTVPDANTVPAGIIDGLAELIDPGEPEYLGCKLVLKDTGAIKKTHRALATITGKTSIGERTQFRDKRLWKKIVKRLRGD